MTSSTEAQVWTDAAFMALSQNGHRYELVDGELHDMGSSGMEHGEIGAYLAGLLAIYVRRNKLGTVCDSSRGRRKYPHYRRWSGYKVQGLRFKVESCKRVGKLPPPSTSTAFTLRSGNKRSPDVSFVAKFRLQGMTRPPRGFFQGSPDLAVEILSPNHTVEEIHGKIVEYFENETQLVWVIHPDEKYVLIYHAPEPDGFLRPADQLNGEDVVPGFSIAIADLFKEWDF